MKNWLWFVMVLTLTLSMLPGCGAAAPTTAPTAPQPSTAPAAAQPVANSAPTQPAAAAPAPTKPAPTAVQAPAAGQQVTLKVVDVRTDATQGAAMDKMNKLFMEKYPNIKVQREAMQLADLQSIAPTNLSAGTTWDVIEYGPGDQYAGVLADAGLIRPMDDAAKKFGWDKKFFKWATERTMWNGKVYGVPTSLATYGCFYNQDQMKRLNLAVPKTYDDLLNVVKVAKDGGLIPIAFGDLEKWPAYHSFSLMANNLLGNQKLEPMLYTKASWDDPDIVKAIKLWFVDLPKASAFNQDPVATKVEDSRTMFYSGKALMICTGTFLTGRVDLNSKGFTPGFFYFPAIDGKPINPPAGADKLWVTPTKAPHPAEAELYLDFLTSPEASKIWLEDVALIPAWPVDLASLKLSPTMKLTLTELARQDITMGHNIDVEMPSSFALTMGDGFQAVLLGQKSPEQMAKDLQKAKDDAIASGAMKVK